MRHCSLAVDLVRESEATDIEKGGGALEEVPVAIVGDRAVIQCSGAARHGRSMDAAMGMGVDDPRKDRASRSVDEIGATVQTPMETTRQVDVPYLAAAHKHVGSRKHRRSVACDDTTVLKHDVHIVLSNWLKSRWRITSRSHLNLRNSLQAHCPPERSQLTAPSGSDPEIRSSSTPCAAARCEH